MLEEEDGLGAGSTAGLVLDEVVSSVAGTRQAIIDGFSGNRRIVRKGLPTVIERIEATGSGEGTDLFTPPAASPRGIEPPSHP